MDAYMYPNAYICIEGEKEMSGFGKKCYTKPVLCQHDNDLSKDWYVFFRFKNEGKVHSYKRREGINRIEDLNDRLSAIEELRDDIEFDLICGWNPIKDPKRALEYGPVSPEYNRGDRRKEKVKKLTKEDYYLYFLNRRS